MMDFTNKKVLVSGGTSGIGKAIALRFAKAGASVFIIGTNPDKGEKALSELNAVSKNKNQQFLFYAIDVSDHSECKNVVKQLIEKHQIIDVLINCAGITKDKLFMTMSESDWDDVLDVNLKSVYNLTHALIRPMIKTRRGKIINITSVIGLTGNPGQVNYSASKFGMIGFTRSLAIEVAAKGVCVNAIAPGFIRTDMTHKLNDRQKEQILQKIPAKRMGECEDIANAAIFLASDLADYINGQVLVVDGGMLA